MLGIIDMETAAAAAFHVICEIFRWHEANGVPFRHGVNECESREAGP